MNLSCVLLSVRLCRTQRKSAPTGGRRRRREGESWVERRRSQTSQWLHGVLYIRPAAMDCNPPSLFFILHLLMSCVLPAFTTIYPPNEGKSTLRLRTVMCVCVSDCAWGCVVRSGTDRGMPCARIGSLFKLTLITTRRSKARAGDSGTSQITQSDVHGLNFKTDLNKADTEPRFRTAVVVLSYLNGAKFTEKCQHSSQSASGELLKR